jgi:hypothetical protein
LETPSDTGFYGVATEFDRLIVALRMSYLRRVLLLPLARSPLLMPIPPYPLIPVSAGGRQPAGPGVEDVGVPRSGPNQ